MNHKDKVELARRLRTPKELKRGVSIWDTEGWGKHKQAVENKVKKTEARQKEASRLRKERLAKEKQK